MAKVKTEIVLRADPQNPIGVAHGISSVTKWLYGGKKDDGEAIEPEPRREMNLGTDDDSDGPRVIVPDPTDVLFLREVKG